MTEYETAETLATTTPYLYTEAGGVMKIHPNPFKKQTTVEVEEGDDKIKGYHLYDDFGRLVKMHWGQLKESVTLDCSDLPPGTYSLKILSDKQVIGQTDVTLEE